jgi:hypothetical protein
VVEEILHKVREDQQEILHKVREDQQEIIAKELADQQDQQGQQVMVVIKDQ